jgi:exonuclease VII small subunit
MTTPAGDDGSTPVEDLTYTEASRELDAIVGFFEQREVDVDQLVVRLERASAIVDELDRRVRQTRAQVEELVPRLEAVNRSSDDDGPADDPSEETIGDGAEDGQALF